MESLTNNNQNFFVQLPSGKERPLIISVPHSGIDFPQDIVGQFVPEAIAKPADTDWFVHELYDFAPQLGFTLFHARYSRYVIDLNRDPHGQKLYHDNRVETSLVPTKTFGLEPLYKDALPSLEEIERRKELYFFPYHQAISFRIKQLQKKFKHVLFFDGHSIKRFVPSIRPDPFPDLILGDQDEGTAHPDLIQNAMISLAMDGKYQVSHNSPFKGGFLTRSIGNPEKNIHALQLEMSQDIYMDEVEVRKIPDKFDVLKMRLKDTLMNLADAVENLS